MITLEQIAHRCDKVRWQGKDTFIACCVAHDDRNPSMSVTERDGKILAHCHAGCPQDAVIDALGITSSESGRSIKNIPFMPPPKVVRNAPDTTSTESRAARAVELSTTAPSNHPYLVKKGIQPNGIGVLGGLYPDLPKMVRRTRTVMVEIDLPPHEDGKSFTCERIDSFSLPSGETMEVSNWKTEPREMPQNVLVIPMANVHGKILSCQFIAEDGSKAYMAGPKRKGGFYYMRGSDRLWICEGFATGASLHEDTGDSVACAFDTGGLMRVTDALTALYPERDIRIMADDDWQTDGNPGLTKARQAADVCGVQVVLPDFAPYQRGPKDTDYNDVARLRDAG